MEVAKFKESDREEVASPSLEEQSNPEIKQEIRDKLKSALGSHHMPNSLELLDETFSTIAEICALYVAAEVTHRTPGGSTIALLGVLLEASEPLTTKELSEKTGFTVGDMKWTLPNIRIIFNTIGEWTVEGDHKEGWHVKR